MHELIHPQSYTKVKIYVKKFFHTIFWYLKKFMRAFGAFIWKIGSWSLQIWIKITLHRYLPMLKLLLIFDEFFLYLSALHRNLNFLEQKHSFLNLLTQLNSLIWRFLLSRGFFNFTVTFLLCLGFFYFPVFFYFAVFF